MTNLKLCTKICNENALQWHLSDLALFCIECVRWNFFAKDHHSVRWCLVNLDSGDLMALYNTLGRKHKFGYLLVKVWSNPVQKMDTFSFYEKWLWASVNASKWVGTVCSAKSTWLFNSLAGVSQKCINSVRNFSQVTFRCLALGSFQLRFVVKQSEVSTELCQPEAMTAVAGISRELPAYRLHPLLSCPALASAHTTCSDRRIFRRGDSRRRRDRTVADRMLWSWRRIETCPGPCREVVNIGQDMPNYTLPRRQCSSKTHACKKTKSHLRLRRSRLSTAPQLKPKNLTWFK